MEILGLSWITWSLFSSIPLLYWYFTRNFNYWKKRGVQSPNPVPILGTAYKNFVTPMPLSEQEWYEKYGPIYGTYNKQQPILTIGEPELIKQILVKDFHLFSDRKERKIMHKIIGEHLFNSKGDKWKRLRSIMSPTFTSGKMKKMYPMIRDCLNEFLEVLEKAAQNRENINVKDMHGNFTMDVIATCAFATKTNAHKDANNPFIINAKKVFNPNIYKMFAILLLPKSVLQMLGIKSITDETSNQFFINLIRHILRQRKQNPKSNKQFNDFIQLMADAEKDKEKLHDDYDVHEAHHVNDGKEELEVEKKTLSLNVTNKTLTEDEIIAQGWLFFIAGYETTATTLSYCSYELAINPDVQERLYQEVVSAMDENGEISYEELAKLPFLDAVISETLRMYPPVTKLERKALADTKLGNTGIQLKKGDEVEIPVYAIQHSEKYYASPNRFDPDRFMPHNRHNIKPYTYLPFGAGPRNCIGMRFALMEAKLGLVQIVKRYRFLRAPQTAVPVQFKTNTNLCAAKSLIVGIEKRDP